MPSQGGVPRSGDSEGASDRYGGQAQPEGTPGGHSQSQGYGRPQGPYAAGAPLAQPASHLVAVKPGLKDTAIQLAGQAACLLLGIVPLVLAIQRPHVRGMWIALAVGGLFLLIGLLMLRMLPRVLRTRRYAFTSAGLEGVNLRGEVFTLPWSVVTSVAIRAFERQPLATLRRGTGAVRHTAHLQITVQPGTDLGGPVAAMASGYQVTIPFWNQFELIDSMAYGCATFAAAKFRGVTML